MQDAERRTLDPGWLVVVGGAMLVVASFLPWAKLTAPFVGTITKAGVDNGGDGIATLIGGAVLALCGWMIVGRHSPWLAVAVLIVAVGLGLLLVFDFVDIASRFADIEQTVASTDYGAGLYLAAVGVVVAGVGGIWASW